MSECSYLRKSLKFKNRKLNLEVVVTSEVMVYFYQHAWFHIPEDGVRVCVCVCVCVTL